MCVCLCACVVCARVRASLTEIASINLRELLPSLRQACVNAGVSPLHSPPSSLTHSLTHSLSTLTPQPQSSPQTLHSKHTCAAAEAAFRARSIASSLLHTAVRSTCAAAEAAQAASRACPGVLCEVSGGSGPACREVAAAPGAGLGVRV